MIKTRATAIIIADHKILLIQRKKNNHDFFTFPGGTVENNETPEIAVIREVEEETSLLVQLIKPIYFGWIHNTLNEHFYLCEYISGVARLSDNAIEHTRMAINDAFIPIWMPIDQLSTLEIYPCDIIQQLIHDINTNFNDEIKTFELINTQKKKHLLI